MLNWHPCLPRSACALTLIARLISAGSHKAPNTLPQCHHLQGAGDVLAQLAAQSAAAAGQGFAFEAESMTPTCSDRRGSSVTFDRIAPCLLPEQKQVRPGGGRCCVLCRGGIAAISRSGC
jgi:hypothetical protein